MRALTSVHCLLCRVFESHDDWVEGLLVCDQDGQGNQDQAFFSFSADGHVCSWDLDTEQYCDIYRLVVSKTGGSEG